jgi:hypothetical protein
LRDVLKQNFKILLDARWGCHHLITTVGKLYAELLRETPGVVQEILDAAPYFYGDGFTYVSPG